MKKNMNRLSCLIITVILIFVAVSTGFSGEWVKEPLKGLLPGGKVTEEKGTKLTGKVVSREEKDKKGEPVTSAVLEQNDGTLIPLPCEPKQEKKGVVGKTAGKARGKDPGCWKYMGQKVEIIGDAQSITKKTKRIRRLTNITGINPL
jgi:hypothetical protein